MPSICKVVFIGTVAGNDVASSLCSRTRVKRIRDKSVDMGRNAGNVTAVLRRRAPYTADG